MKRSADFNAKERRRRKGLGAVSLRRAFAFTCLALALAAAAGCAKREARPETLADRGKNKFVELGCNACHTINGTAGVGPTLKGLYGSEVELADGTRVRADEAYIRESILDPDAKTVQGFSKGVMAAAVPRSTVEQGDTVEALVAYIKTLK